MKFIARISINSINVSPSFEFKLLRNARDITKVYILLGQPSYVEKVIRDIFKLLNKCINCNNLGPAVQSIVSLTSSLRDQLVKCITTL